MTWVIAAGALIALYGLHRTALWMESRGWIYYLKKKASPDALGNAVLGIQKIVQPSSEYVLEFRRKKRVQRDDSGGPPKAG